jgi:hypothetical protein
MAVRNPPLHIQAGSYTAENDRLLIDSIWTVEGTIKAGDLLVTAAGGMNVNVSAGTVVVEGDNSAVQGSYLCRADTSQGLTIATASGSNPRKDIIVAEVLDNAYGIAGDLWQLRVIAGNPAASPAEPALPNTAVKLAVIDVPTSAVSIASGNITNVDFYHAFGPGAGPVPINSLFALPPSPWAGLTVIDKTTGAMYYWTGSAWLACISEIPHMDVSRIVPTAAFNVSGTAYADWPSVGAGGPCQVVNFYKSRADTKLIFTAEGDGYAVNGAGHRYTLAVNYGAGDVELTRWWDSGLNVHAHHGGSRAVSGIGVGSKTVTLRIKTDAAAGITAWQCDTQTTWSLKVEEVM